MLTAQTGPLLKMSCTPQGYAPLKQNTHYWSSMTKSHLKHHYNASPLSVHHTEKHGSIHLSSWIWTVDFYQSAYIENKSTTLIGVMSCWYSQAFWDLEIFKLIFHTFPDLYRISVSLGTNPELYDLTMQHFIMTLFKVQTLLFIYLKGKLKLCS